MVSWEFNSKLAPLFIASNKVVLFTPFVELAVLTAVTPANSLRASGFKRIVPNSGNTNPYEPEFSTYPLPENAFPFDPETNWYTLDEPTKVFTKTSFELSVKCTSPLVPVNFKFKDPGKRDSYI